MQKRTIVMLFLLAGLYGGQVLAAEAAVVASEKPVPAVKKYKKEKHKKDCVEQKGKPCHLHSKKYAKKVATDTQNVKPVAEMSKVSANDKVASGVAAAALSTTLLPIASVVAPSAAVPFAEGIALARKSGCLACHVVAGVPGGGGFGPKWNEVAIHYRGDSNAEAFLADKIARGGSGVWGRNVMPANSPRVSDADVRTLTRFVLSLQ